MIVQRIRQGEDKGLVGLYTGNQLGIRQTIHKGEGKGVVGIIRTGPGTPTISHEMTLETKNKDELPQSKATSTPGRLFS